MTNETAGGQQHRMPPSTRFRGELIDLSSRRSAKLVPNENGSVRFESTDRHAVIDYFYHLGQFWRAVIPLDAVDEVLGQAFNFSKPKTVRGKDGPTILFNRHGMPRRRIPMLNHVQCRFKMNPENPIKLYGQDSPSVGAPEGQVHDFVYSLEATGPVGCRFNLRDALAGNFICAHRMISTEEMVFERIVVENQYVSQSPPLPLTNREKRDLLTASLLRSHHAGISDIYYLYRCCGTNNCTSSPFQILDKVVNYNFLEQCGSVLYRLPLSPRFYLRVRGLDSDPSVRQLVREEFATYIEDPAVRQRKRAYVREQIRIRRAARDQSAD